MTNAYKTKIVDLEEDVDKNKTMPKSESVAQPTLPVPLVVWRMALVFSVFLYSSFTIFVHLCEVDGRLPFRSTPVVLLVELAKLIISMVMFGFTSDVYKRSPSSGNGVGFIKAMQTEIIRAASPDEQTRDERGEMIPSPASMSSQLASRRSLNRRLLLLVLPFMVPAVLYGLNNNLGIHIQLEMDPATYQVMANFKILTTAILFRLIIKRKISLLQWFALLLLLSAGFTHSFGNLNASDVKKDAVSTNVSHEIRITTLGIVYLIVYCTVSGLSGVYTEYVMKKCPDMNINLQNGLLYSFGVILNGIAFVAEVSRTSDVTHFFDGFSFWTWLIIITQAFMGISMGFVMKYSSNITRLFIIASAMLVTTFASVLIFGLHLNIYFLGALVLVTLAMYLYHL